MEIFFKASIASSLSSTAWLIALYLEEHRGGRGAHNKMGVV